MSILINDDVQKFFEAVEFSSVICSIRFLMSYGSDYIYLSVDFLLNAYHSIIIINDPNVPLHNYMLSHLSIP